tara:strand:+ start:27259 stop:27429 length:171 start_codon:yes stop_codon:yes gene_type:complete
VKLGDLVRVRDRFSSGEDYGFGIILEPPNQYGDAIVYWIDDGEIVCILDLCLEVVQ